MRIVGGRFRGTRLATPKDRGVRPTSERVREAVFNILTHAIPDFELEGARVLDLFAGTGALGLEAISRGAVFCLFVEQAADARGLIRRNIEQLGLTGHTKTFRRDAASLGAAGRIAPFDLVFCDPPYGRGLAGQALAGAAEGGWLVPGAIIVAEEARDATFEPGAGFALADARDYGDTTIRVARWTGAAA